ncbi:unnamed protein product [Umbelopsis sp. WA50703]
MGVPEVDSTNHDIPSPPKLCTKLITDSRLQMATIYNPIQLAAISNYKLAQLTFTTPDDSSLLKTALIKNMLEKLYEVTPPEWLDQMTRWEFFSPESMADMTQQELEEIFVQYAYAMETPKQPMVPISPVEDEFWTDDVDWEGDSEDPLSKRNSLFSQPNETIISSESVDTAKDRQTGKLSDSILNSKALPANPPLEEKPRKLSTNPFRNRLSWGSELKTSGSPSQHLASELMSLFDMEFKVDIHINTAPKLPELPFKPSQDKSKKLASDNHSIMSLVSELETFTIEDLDVRQPSPLMTFPPPPSIPPSLERRTSRRSSSLAYNANSSWTTRKPVESSVPKRSSSLSVASSPRISTPNLERNPTTTSLPEGRKAPSAQSKPADGVGNREDKALRQDKKLKKKSSFRHLAELMTMKKSNSPYNASNQSKPTTSSSWVSLPEMGNEADHKSHSSSQASVATVPAEATVDKPLPNSPKRNPNAVVDNEHSSKGNQNPARSSSLKYKHAKKRRSVEYTKRSYTAPAGYGLGREGTVTSHPSKQVMPRLSVSATREADRNRQHGLSKSDTSPHNSNGHDLITEAEDEFSSQRKSILAHRRSLTPAGLDLTDGIPVEDPGFVTIGKGIGNYHGATNQTKDSRANATGKFIKRMVSLGRAMRVRNGITA